MFKVYGSDPDPRGIIKTKVTKGTRPHKPP